MSDATTPSKSALRFILLTMVIDSIGFGLIIPVMPELLEELLHCSEAVAAKWSGLLTVAYAAMSFLFGPLIGGLSDRFGRRPVLLLALAALACDYLIIGFATSIGALFAGRILAGICGATQSTANAFIADVTSNEERGKALGKAGAAFGIGFIVGPAIGGWLGTLTPRAPFFAAAGLAMVNMLYGCFVLPESLAVEKRRPLRLKRSNPFGAFSHFASLPNVRWLLVSMTLYYFAQVVYPSTWSFHAVARYEWSTEQIGWSLMVFGVGSAIVQGGLIGAVLRRFGAFRTALLGFAFNIIAMTGFGFAWNASILYLFLPIAALGALVGPSINSIMSARVAENSQGELQGALASVHGLSNMASPLVMTGIFGHFVADTAPYRIFGAAFFLAATLISIAVAPFVLGAQHRQAVAS